MYQKSTTSRSKKERPKYSKPAYHDKWDQEYVVKKAGPLLEFLIATIPHQSRNNIKHLLSNKKILVDGVSISQFDYPLHMKQVVRISKTPIIQESMKGSLKIIYEDDDFIAINKPAGLLSIASDREDRNTAYRMVSDYARQLDKKSHIYTVHRLDKETSGVLIFSKSLKFKDMLQEDWNKNVTLREYIAIVVGEMKPSSGTIHTWLKQNNAQLMYSTTNKKLGQEAITEYKVLKTNRDYSLVEVKLHTGRKNQIRVHFSEKGNPVIGDDKYGEKVPNPLKRLGLHASKLEFIHPFTKKKILIKTSIPLSFNRLFR
ncbi:MAG: RluA family pseudouridine synthase [Bacilli bacterium]